MVSSFFSTFSGYGKIRPADSETGPQHFIKLFTIQLFSNLVGTMKRSQRKGCTLENYLELFHLECDQYSNINCSARLSSIDSLSLPSGRLCSWLLFLKFCILKSCSLIPDAAGGGGATFLLITLYDSLSKNMLPCLHTCCETNFVSYLCRESATKIMILSFKKL